MKKVIIFLGVMFLFSGCEDKKKDGPIEDAEVASHVLSTILNTCRLFDIPTSYSHTYTDYYEPSSSNKVIINGQVSMYEYLTTTSAVESSTINITFTFNDFFNNSIVVDGDITYYEYKYHKTTLSYYDSNYSLSIAGVNVHIEIPHPFEEYNIIDDITFDIWDVDKNQYWLRGTITGKSGITYEVDF